MRTGEQEAVASDQVVMLARTAPARAHNFPTVAAPAPAMEEPRKTEKLVVQKAEMDIDYNNQVNQEANPACTRV